MGDKVRKLTMIIVLLSVFLIPIKVEAKSLNDFYNELADLEKKYEEANSSKKLNEQQLEQLGKEINSINASILQAQEDIKQAEQDIEDSNKKIEEKKNETNELMKFLQITSGGNVYLEYLFEAESYTDFIYRYSIVTQMSGYNNKLMEELETLIAELNTKKQTLSDKQKDLESQRKTLNDKQTTLRANISELEVEGTTIEEDIADMKKQIQVYEAQGCSRYQDITTCQATSVPTADGWNYPLLWGCVTSEYTTYREDWNPGSEHHGIDLSCVAEGTNVYATAEGMVARVVYGSTCGGNMVYVYHNVNGKAYTSVYMHLLSISVSNGQIVFPSTVIGRMGGGSTSTAHGGYDRCTTGAHLHFGLAEGHNAYSFNSYYFNPRNIFYFPQIYGGYFSR